MSVIQSTILVVIILGFVGIVGWEMYYRIQDYREVQKAKHRKLMKKLDEESN